MNAANEDADFGSTDSQILCTSCGICCKGYVFDRGYLVKKRRRHSKVTSVNVYKHCDKYYFSMPCPANHEQFLHGLLL